MIVTERLTLRRFLPEDWKDLYEYLSDPDVVLFEPYGVQTQEECKKEAARRASDDAFWAVVLTERNKVIGNVYLAKQEFDTWELGYVFNARFQGCGYATESAKALVDYVIKNEYARRIAAMCNPKNEKSWKLLERLNMRREGHLHQNIYFKTDENGNPLWADTYEYAILAQEWSKAGQ